MAGSSAGPAQGDRWQRVTGTTTVTTNQPTLNMKLKFESFGNRNLWQFISGTGLLRPKELIERDLTRNKDKLLNGLLFYKKPGTPAGSQLKEKNLSKQQSDFVQKLSKFLGLDEGKAYDLFCSYISQDFRGSQKNLQLSLSTDRHSHVLLYKIRDFYFSERLYLLQIVRHVLTYCSDGEHHPYQEEYNLFLGQLLGDDNLVTKLLGQLDLLCDAPLPTWETHGTLMNDRQSLIWAHQNLKEQHELLETLLVYWKEFEVSVKHLVKLLEKFKRQGFGRRQTYRHILDESMDRMLKRIGSLEVLVILQAMDMEQVERMSHSGRFEDHSFLKDKSAFQTIDKTISLFGSEPPHGPILLAWAAARQLYLGPAGDRSSVTRKLGNQALQLGVFDFLSEMLSQEPISGKTVTASLAHVVVYTVLMAALTAFDETTLTRNVAEMQVLYDISSRLLRRDVIAGSVWTRGLDQGLGSLFQTALLNFPLDFSTLVKLSTSLASATKNSASKVLDLWSELPRYTEYLDRNSAQDIRATHDPDVWQLIRDKLPYTAGDFRICAGVYGRQISGGRKPVSDMEIPVIQWEAPYDGWQLLMCEVLELLNQVSHGAGMVSPIQVARVTEVTQFVRAICTSQPQATQGLADIIALFYTLLQRFSGFNPPPLDLLAACLECVTCVAKLDPAKAWHDIKQSELLPYLTENIDNMAEVTSGQGLSPGLYGAVLAGFESTQGRYPLTTAFLDFTAEMVMPLYKLHKETELMPSMMYLLREILSISQKWPCNPLYKLHKETELMPSMMYLLREILPVFQKWPYYNSARKELIGQKCLKIAHKILNLRAVGARKKPGKPHLQEVCVYSLLYTEAGRALLEIIATGVDTVELLLSQQSSQSEGAGEDLVQLIQVGFSVMNRLLLLRSHDHQMSPVEVALTSQPAGYQNQHIVAVIAEYIYHRTNPQLPRLATLFLRRLAVVLPMSILACLGNQAEPIRDIYLMRLHSTTEDLGLKTGILELLSDCVDTQPGLIEIFLNVQTTQQKGTNKDLAVGRTSCIQTVLDLVDVGKQSSYQCTPDLLCACTNFIQALWAGMRETAMEALRTKSNFWPSLCEPLFKDLSETGEDQMMTFKLRTVSNIFKILAQEIYTVTGGKLDANLKKILKTLSEKGRIRYWSTYITDCIKSAEVETQDISADVSHDTLDHPTHKLLVAWKNFLVVIAKINVTELKLDDGVKELIIVDLLDALHVLFTNNLNELSHKLSQTCSALYLTLMGAWKSCVKVWSQVIQKTLETLSLTLTSGDMVIPSVQIGLLGALTVILQHLRLEANKRVEMQRLVSMLNSVCEMLLQSTRELPSPSDLKQRQQTQDSVDKSFTGIDHKLKLQIVACCCVEEIIHHIRDVAIWLPVLQENMILTALLSSANIYLKGQEGLHYIQPLFILLLTIAKSDKGAEAIAMAGLTSSVCLPITYCYQGCDIMTQSSATKQGKTKAPPGSQVTWHGVYCLCLELYSSLLETLKYSFLEDAFNFVGSHQERLQQCLDIARFSLHVDAFREVEKTCHFVNQLSHFSREWRLHLPDSLNSILTRMMYMCQTFVSYLIRPRYLQHTLEQHWADKGPGKRGQDSLMIRTLAHQSSTEDLDNPTQQHVTVQLSMLKALSHSFVALRQFSPGLVQILIDTNMDVGEYEPFLAVGFSAPPVDQDTPPTFGSMLSCVTVCMRLLHKIEPRSVSPQKGDPNPSSSPGETTLSQCVPKSLVLFVMENALYLLMSQCMLYLKEPAVPHRDKQLLKRELGTEMNSVLSSIHRYFRRGGPQSPATAGTQPSPRTQQSPAGPTLSRSISQTFVSGPEQGIYKLVQEFSTQVLR